MIELLVVIAIIAMLTGLLTPGIKVVNRAAKGLKQKSVFHGYETGLELYRKDFGDYPRSKVKGNAFGSGQIVTGSQHLAEALMGRDLKGYDPDTEWCSATEDPICYTDDPKSLRRRKNHYTDIKDDGAYLLEEVYGAGAVGNIFSHDGTGRKAPVMTDIFKRKTITLLNGQNIKIGTPVLYFKANTTTKRFMGAEPMSNHTRWIYNYEHNRDIIELGTIRDQNQKHKFDQSQTVTVPEGTFNGMEYFYQTLMNPQFHTVDSSGAPTGDRPYNPNKFILISAGWDGIFGTKDDITNFDY